MHKAILPLAILAQLATATAAYASETVLYTYDAKGRLVKVERAPTSTINTNVVTTYTYDKADNRTNVKTTGSTN